MGAPVGISGLLLSGVETILWSKWIRYDNQVRRLVNILFDNGDAQFAVGDGSHIHAAVVQSRQDMETTQRRSTW